MLYEAEFWVAVAFVIFLAIVWKVGGFKTLIAGLDARADRIRAELAEARRLREEAASLLSSYERRRAEAEQEAAEIISNARDEAERLARETQDKMADFVKRRTAAAEAKIAQAETQAAAEVRAAAVDAAIKASERILRGEITGDAAEALLTRSLGDVRSKLNS
jgi:F-type H+-transporting ATPase subunit b